MNITRQEAIASLHSERLSNALQASEEAKTEILYLKRYKNRKLYCLNTSDYTTHKELMEHVRQGGSFQVTCNVTYLDLTLDVITTMVTRLIHDRASTGVITREQMIGFIRNQGAGL